MEARIGGGIRGISYGTSIISGRLADWSFLSCLVITCLQLRSQSWSVVTEGQGESQTSNSLLFVQPNSLSLILTCVSTVFINSKLVLIRHPLFPNFASRKSLDTEKIT